MKSDAEAPAFPTGAEYRSRLSWFIGVSDPRPIDPGSLTYEPAFGLREKPFSLASDPRFFCNHASHGAAFDTLAGGIRRREGILVLTGEVGTGKTTLCRAVLQSLDQKTFAAFVPDPFLSREDLLKTLLVDFGVVSIDDIRSGRLRGATRTDLSYPLYDFLTSLQPLKAFAVVMIDEAQNLTPELLEEIRILSDLENGQRLLEVVLVGQPELRSRLATPELRQLRQRVSIQCELTPLAQADVQTYVSRRLLVAGNDGRVRFTDSALDTVSAVSGGIPRVINLVCDRALLRAARSGTMTVGAEHIRGAVGDLALSDVQPPQAPARNEDEPFPPEQVDGFWEPEPVRPPPAKVEVGLPAAPPPVPARVPKAPEEALAVTPPQRSKVMAFAGGCLALASSVVVVPLLMVTPIVIALVMSSDMETANRLKTEWARRQSIGLVEPLPPQTMPPSVEVRPVEPPAVQTVEAGPVSPRLVIQVATFQSSTRVTQALRELREAGYNAYSVEVPLRDGARALAVFLGPYAERDSAERDLERARQIPGYDGGRVVELTSSPAPPTSQP